ncbi:Retrovirus-related Pol polyprotein from transposon gypsy [Chionoecetes opilio]|uniref:Retrovirus-related Pol polyprotein from transposon gypsy n=1 Tax=Chionoecetes opilio TaxID=41210 RepID=A0A8J4YB77_CHIOP|nr:Retrovirus-related Pol polyprotein from transposon gypsy [Chionoecetes opilio]
MVRPRQPGRALLAVAPVMEPFRELLKKPGGKAVYWDKQLEALFTSPKTLLDDWRPRDCASMMCRALQQSSLTTVARVLAPCPAAVCECVRRSRRYAALAGGKLVLCGSRHLTAAERNYSTLEGEALAIAWCLKKARLFLLGCKNLTLVTDHKALTRIFGDKETKGHSQPRILKPKREDANVHLRIKYLKRRHQLRGRRLVALPDPVRWARRIGRRR